MTVDRNLIDVPEATVVLLSRPLEWRTRVVEEIVVDSATSCLRRRSLQVAPLRSLLGGFVDGGDTHALVAINVAPVPRGPLVDFDIEGPLGEAWLLPRVEIGRRQALYIATLSQACGHEVSDGLLELITAILGFTGEWFAEGRVADLEEYLDVGLDNRPSRESVAQWRAIGDACREILRPRLDAFDRYSAPENPAIVLPELFANGVVSTEAGATAVLGEYRAMLEHAEERADDETPDEAVDLLVSLADYGNDFDLIVGMRVPLDEPFLIKYSERRDLRLSLLRGSGSQKLVIADAQTNHFTFKVTDPNVRISHFAARQVASNAYAYGAFQSREDGQSRAVYAHDPDRDYRIRLTFRLAFLRRLQVIPYLAFVLLALLTLALIHEAPTQLKDLALIVGPSALAASVLLAREPSTLGSRLRFVSSGLLFLALLSQLGVAVGLYLGLLPRA
ncbi:hypothetical protein [Clavibacter nebraskensis]|nr:hypothetical protein [Clavibacter nebraskensis]QGV67717.2 hypothetical protein EGX36_13300 [Clavibacter nebraskensis]QGV70516.2 hypothetical protein EGX37_13255 [Clavibacter nebraskensis]QGV73307.2 hypothetical protein EGX35_13255 [Clavibacter nebraskensis]UKF28692.1 hypothetical protein FGQ65_11120 [Clavibacter nebraskensis]UQB04790.1 hypothetical protein LIV34_002658 [Clavibacter nebraskensis]